MMQTKLIASDRNLYGSPRADITIVEFSDVECPFCARVHPTIERLVDESDGQINWEYRHLPLPYEQWVTLLEQS